MEKCYIYTRVSTEMQVDGYSLDAQRDRLVKHAYGADLKIIDEYSDAGSGKNTDGRPNFLRMLSDIQNKKDNISFVLVFKLSRFGRNSADVLNSLQLMQDFGVNLICVEDSIDSSKDSGKLMISVLSAVAEIERENILVQTMLGRRRKASEGKWNGGFAPFGYKLIDGYLYIAEDEAEIIRIIFDKFTYTNMGLNAIAKYLNEHGYKKKKRQKNNLETYSYNFVKGVIDNPIYMGKMPYGRRKNEKIDGERNKYHIVKQKDYMLEDGVHDAIISEELWKLAQDKRKKTGGKREKVHSLDHSHILSGVLRCPSCGGPMYGNVNRKKRKDGTFYPDFFYYGCKHRLQHDGHFCTYKKQWKQDKINEAVEEVVLKLVNNEKFADSIKQKIGSKVNTQELELELDKREKFNRKLESAKERLAFQIDLLDFDDKLYQRKYDDMLKRLDKFYVEIAEVEEEIEELKLRIYNINQNKINEDTIYKYLMMFNDLYSKFTDSEKQEFMRSIIERVDIFEEQQEDWRILKSIEFKFPIFFDGEETNKIFLDNLSTVETVVLMSRCKPDAPIEITPKEDEQGETYTKRGAC